MAYLAASHFVHLAEPFSEYFPEAQKPEQVADSILVAEPYLPAMQFLHSRCSLVSAYLPTVHSLHTLPPGLDLPRGHVPHSSFDCAPVFVPPVPGGHSLHSPTFFKPFAALYVPSGQFLQSGSAVTSVAAAVLYLPRSQAADLQRVFPGSSWYSSPGLQSMQVVDEVAPTVSLAVPGAQSLQPCCFVVAPAGTLWP